MKERRGKSVVSVAMSILCCLSPSAGLLEEHCDSRAEVLSNRESTLSHAPSCIERDACAETWPWTASMPSKFISRWVHSHERSIALCDRWLLAQCGPRLAPHVRRRGREAATRDPAYLLIYLACTPHGLRSPPRAGKRPGSHATGLAVAGLLVSLSFFLNNHNWSHSHGPSECQKNGYASLQDMCSTDFPRENGDFLRLPVAAHVLHLLLLDPRPDLERGEIRIHPLCMRRMSLEGARQRGEGPAISLWGGLMRTSPIGSQYSIELREADHA